MSVYLDDGDVVLHHGDALATLRTMPSASVHCIVTSPPFWALRDYGTGTWTGGDDACTHQNEAAPRNTRPAGGLTGGTKTVDAGTITRGATCGRCGATRTDQQIGLEASPDEWCAALVAVFREARRVLRPDGVAWIEVGDTYNANTASNPANLAANPRSKAGVEGHVPNAWSGTQGGTQANRVAGIKPKDLVGAPWLLAFALRADGWYLRSDTIWHRPNPMPESVTDRPTKAHSYVFLLAKEPRYFYDADAIRDAAANDPRAGGRQAALARSDDKYAQAAFKDAHDDGRVARLNATKRRTVRPGVDTNGGGQGAGEMTFPADTANARTVWTIPTEPTPYAHFATFPQQLAARCIQAGTSAHGCCAACGAPWTRSSERVDDHPEVSRDAMLRAKRATELGAFHGSPVKSTLGSVPEWQSGAWTASCACNAAVEPCTVLDPFAGTATTLLVARRHGRRAVGIELSTKYLAIAATRLQQLSLLDHNPAT